MATSHPPWRRSWNARSRSQPRKRPVCALQKAADGFRALRDLTKARDTQRWLKANGITIEALEDYLEANILISKFKDKLTKSAPKKLTASKAVKDTVRRIAYQSWLATAMK